MKLGWIVVSLLLAAPMFGQDGSTASADAATDRLPNYQPANAGDRVNWFAVSTVGPLSLLAAGPISAGFSTGMNTPRAMGRIGMALGSVMACG